MSDNDSEPDSPVVQIPRKRLILGAGVLVAGQLLPLLIPFVAASFLSTTLKATLSAFLFFAAPPMFTFSAVAILGKDGFNFLKARLFAFFRRHVRIGPVSRVRYYTGLVLFAIPILLAWLTPYLSEFFPLFDECQLVIAVTGDAILIVSLLVLGGDFWEKLRNLFVYQSRRKAEVLP